MSTLRLRNKICVKMIQKVSLHFTAFHAIALRNKPMIGPEKSVSYRELKPTTTTTTTDVRAMIKCGKICEGWGQFTLVPSL